MLADSSETPGLHLEFNLSTAWAEVAATVTAVDAALGKWLLDKYGVGLTEYRALLHLSRTPEHELRITQLAHKVGLNQSSVTRLVGRIEDKELVYREICPNDGRGVYAVITKKGLELIANAREPFEMKISEFLSSAVKQNPQLGSVNLGQSFEKIGKLTL